MQLDGICDESIKPLPHPISFKFVYTKTFLSALTAEGQREAWQADSPLNLK